MNTIVAQYESMVNELKDHKRKEEIMTTIMEHYNKNTHLSCQQILDIAHYLLDKGMNLYSVIECLHNDFALTDSIKKDKKYAELESLLSFIHKHTSIAYDAYNIAINEVLKEYRRVKNTWDQIENRTANETDAQWIERINIAISKMIGEDVAIKDDVMLKFVANREYLSHDAKLELANIYTDVYLQNGLLGRFVYTLAQRGLYDF